VSNSSIEHASLCLRGVAKTFANGRGARVLALSPVDLSIAPGEIVAVVGTSGCGKSTLLRIAAGLEREHEGTVQLDGTAVTGQGPGLERGLLFQEHRLMPWLTVEENVAFGVRALAPDARQATVAKHIARVGLEGFERLYPHQLSGGMAQRAALARALAPEPRVLLLDEPFAALDALTKMHMQEEILRIWDRERTTLLLVTHDIEEAVFLGDRVVVMTGRPGAITEVIPITLRRPRERTSATFAAVRREVYDSLFARHSAASSPPRRIAAMRRESDCQTLELEDP
jgi:sulfonate transport system ATP-binding protein